MSPWQHPRASVLSRTSGTSGASTKSADKMTRMKRNPQQQCRHGPWACVWNVQPAEKKTAWLGWEDSKWQCLVRMQPTPYNCSHEHALSTVQRLYSGLFLCISWALSWTLRCSSFCCTWWSRMTWCVDSFNTGHRQPNPIRELLWRGAPGEFIFLLFGHCLVIWRKCI